MFFPFPVTIPWDCFVYHYGLLPLPVHHYYVSLGLELAIISASFCLCLSVQPFSATGRVLQYQPEVDSLKGFVLPLCFFYLLNSLLLLSQVSAAQGTH